MDGVVLGEMLRELLKIAPYFASTPMISPTRWALFSNLVSAANFIGDSNRKARV
jgi:hypothetical protein